MILHHGLNSDVEPVVFHELVVEIERDRKSVGHRPRRETQSPQYRHVGRLDAECVPVLEADLTERGDQRDREVPLRGLFVGRPGRLIVGIDFRGRSGAQRVAALGHFVPYVAADERPNGGMIVKGGGDKGVGNTVLNGAQVDV